MTIKQKDPAVAGPAAAKRTDSSWSKTTATPNNDKRRGRGEAVHSTSEELLSNPNH